MEKRLKEIGQLFQSLDPLPFRERDLDSDVEEYVVGWAREMPKNRPLEILIHLPEAEARRDDADQVAEAIGKYFAYRADVVSNDLRELFRVGRGTLAIGLGVLATCSFLARLLEPASPEQYLRELVQEGLIILGWVANWRPMEIFLYDWGPLVRQRRLYRRLSHATVRLVAV
jgi:hypothetical protein